MGASVRIEDEAFSDRRYDRLAEVAGLADADHARGKMAVLWRQCTLEQRYDLHVADIKLVLGDHGVDALLAARLGALKGDRVRIKGTKGRIEWLKKLRNNGRYGHLGGRPKRNPQGLGKKPSRVSENAQSETPPAPAPAPAPAQEDLTTTPVATTVGSKRPSPGEALQRVLSEHQIAVAVSSSQIARFAGLGEVLPHDLEWAAEETEKAGRERGPLKKPVEYFLSVLEGEKDRAGRAGGGNGNGRARRDAGADYVPPVYRPEHQRELEETLRAEREQPPKPPGWHPPEFPEKHAAEPIAAAGVKP